MWSSPEVTNGQIQAYSVLIGTPAGSVYQQEVSGDQRTLIVTSLSKILYRHVYIHLLIVGNFLEDKYIPYNVSVRARTLAGYGNAVSNVAFTEEGGKTQLSL